MLFASSFRACSRSARVSHPVRRVGMRAAAAHRQAITPLLIMQLWQQIGFCLRVHLDFLHLFGVRDTRKLDVLLVNVVHQHARVALHPEIHGLAVPLYGDVVILPNVVALLQGRGGGKAARSGAGQWQVGRRRLFRIA